MKSIERLSRLLADMNVPVLIGLEAQGHIPTVERMLAEGRTWEEIGTAIGWDGPTAQDWYRSYLARNLAQPEGCTRSHPHDNPCPDHDLLTRIARLENQKAHLEAERDRLREEVKGWIKENGPGGWVDDLRKRVAGLLAYKDEAELNMVDLRRIEMDTQSTRSDWDRAHELLDAHGVLTTPPGQCGHHLVERIEAVLAVWAAVGRHSGQCCEDLRYLCNTGPDVKEAIRAHRATFRCCS